MNSLKSLSSKVKVPDVKSLLSKNIGNIASTSIDAAKLLPDTVDVESLKNVAKESLSNTGVESLKNAAKESFSKIDSKSFDSASAKAKELFNGVIPQNMNESISKVLNTQVAPPNNVVSNSVLPNLNKNSEQSQDLGASLSEIKLQLPSSVKDTLKKMDITTFSIYAYLFLIVGLYILFGFILTNCVYDSAVKLYYVFEDTGIFAKPTPTPKIEINVQAADTKCVPPTEEESKIPHPQ